MKKIIRQIINTAISILKIALRSSPKGRYGLKETALDSKCVLLGNGPSLNKYIDSLCQSEGVDFIAVNFFALSDHFFRLKPKHYVFADSAFWNKEEDMHPSTVLLRKELLKSFEKVEWNMTIFIPGKGKKSPIIRSLKDSNSKLRVVAYNTCDFNGFRKIKEWAYRENFAMPIAQNVLIAAAYLAINHGYKRIDIYGGDFSWTESIRVDHNNVVCQIDSHFYDDGKAKLSPVLGYVGRPYRMHNYLSDLAKMFEGCWEVRLYGDSLNVAIKNKNMESFIDAFDKEI